MKLIGFACGEANRAQWDKSIEKLTDSITKKKCYIFAVMYFKYKD